MHADAKETVVLPARHPLERVVLPVAVRLRTLDDGDARRLEVRDRDPQPVVVDDVVRIDHADDRRTSIGLAQREVQRARLEPRPVVEVEEAKARTGPDAGQSVGVVFVQPLDVALDRPPGLFVLRVVVDHEDFEVAVVQPRETGERLDHHLGRLVVARQMDRHERLDRIERRTLGPEVALPVLLPHHLGELERVGQQDHQHRPERGQQQAEHGPVELVQIELERQRHEPDHQRHGRLDHHAEEQPATDPEARERDAERDDREERDDRRDHGLARPGRVRDHRTVERELRLTIGVEDAPVGAGTAFVGALPRLVDGLHQVVVEVAPLRHRQEGADELGLVGDRRGRVDDRIVRLLEVLQRHAAAPRRPADLAHHDLLVRIFAAHRVVALLDVIDGALARYAFPVRQQVHGDEVDVTRDLVHLLALLAIGRQPDIPGFGGRHRHADTAPDDVDVADQLLRRQVATQQGFVADDDAFDVRTRVGLLDQRLDLDVVAVLPAIEPGAGGHRHAVLAGERRDLRRIEGAIGPQPPRVLGQHRDVLVQLRLGRIDLEFGRLIATKAVEGEPVDLPAPRRRHRRSVEPRPERPVGGRDQRGDQHGGRHPAPGDGPCTRDRRGLDPVLDRRAGPLRARRAVRGAVFGIDAQ